MDVSNHPIQRAVVVGAGPAGLAAALKLKQDGVDVSVLEARDHNYNLPPQLNVSQAAVDSLADLGALAELKRTAGLSTASAGRHIAEPDPSRSSADAHTVLDPAPVGELTLAETSTALYDQALARGIDVESHTTATLSKADDGGYLISAQPVDNKFQPNGPARNLGEPDIIVLADGANSRSRQQVGIQTVDSSPAKSYLGGLVDVPIGNTSRFETHDDGGHPIHEMATGHALKPSTWVSVELDHAPGAPADNLSYFLAHASEAVGQPISAKDVIWGGSYPTSVQNKKAATDVAGNNVVLLGDAARTGGISVSGGLNLALTTDVHDLDKLVHDVNGNVASRSDALASYNQAIESASDVWHSATASELSDLRAVPPGVGAA